MTFTVPCLIDLNVLLAFVNEWHEHHEIAVEWMDAQPAGNVVVNRTVQLGLLRLLNTAAFMQQNPLTAEECWSVWSALLADERITFVANEPAGLDAQFVNLSNYHDYAPKLWTDAYLAAFAICGGYRLATLDKGFARYPGLELELLN